MNKLWAADEDIRSLKSLILFGIRGVAAYAYHSAVLGYRDPDVNEFFYKALCAIDIDDYGMKELLPIVMEVGEINLKCMALLDKANTEVYGAPSPTEVVSYPEIVHIEDDKDFTPVIKKALMLGGYPTDMHFTGINGGQKVMTGFSHSAVLSIADTVIEAVKSEAIKHFFLVGGCDGARPGRNYYTEFVKQTPSDSVVLTLSMVLSWYEQKAVCILLTLLHLGIKNILLGPSLPAFVSPGVLSFLAEHHNIAPISTPEEDLKKILG